MVVLVITMSLSVGVFPYDGGCYPLRLSVPPNEVAESLSELMRLGEKLALVLVVRPVVSHLQVHFLVTVHAEEIHDK